MGARLRQGCSSLPQSWEQQRWDGPQVAAECLMPPTTHSPALPAQPPGHNKCREALWWDASGAVYTVTQH